VSYDITDRPSSSHPHRDLASVGSTKATPAFNASSARDPRERRRLLTELLGAVGEGTEIRPPLRVDYGGHIRIGARSFANFGLVVE
jgi:hypothetical protein